MSTITIKNECCLCGQELRRGVICWVENKQGHAHYDCTVNERKHGSCCYCQTCKQPNEDCTCQFED